MRYRNQDACNAAKFIGSKIHDASVRGNVVTLSEQSFLTPTARGFLQRQQERSAAHAPLPKDFDETPSQTKTRERNKRQQREKRIQNLKGVR